MILKSNLGTTYSLTTSWANISGLSITIQEDGYYLTVGNISLQINDNDDTEAYGYLALAINGTTLPSSAGYGRLRISDNNAVAVLTIPINNILYLKKDDVLTVQAYMPAGDNSSVVATTTYIEAINLTKLARGGM